MHGPARSLAVLAAIALATARAHIPSHDNILRIQLWDAEGLSRDPVTTLPPATSPPKHKLRVNLESLNDAMLEEWHGGGRFTRHRVRHKRRRPRHSGDFKWKFHSGSDSINVHAYDYEVPWNVIDMETQGVQASAVSDSASFAEERDASPPMTLRLPQDEEEQQAKQLPVVPKCCASGQNLTFEAGKKKLVCARTSLTFQPVFFTSNDTHMWNFSSNVYETIVGNPCSYDRYRLEPYKYVEDEFYLLENGSLFLPMRDQVLSTKDFCMETFWNDTNPAGMTLPLMCFPKPIVTSKSTLIVYAVGLIISVPFLLATACVYLFITVLRDTHGKALACHTVSLAVAFSCLATTQLAGQAFPVSVCTIMAYVIQFSFVSCFFWLNVMCFDTFLNVRRYINSSVSRRSMRRRFAWYCAYAVLMPVLLLAVTVAMELSPSVPSTYLKPNFGVKSCWFKTDKAALPYFYGPVAIILLSNIVIFIFTARAIAIHYDKLMPPNSDFSTSDDWVRLNTVLGQALPAPEQTSPPREPPPENFDQRLKKYKKILRTCCLLSAIMGLSWAMEVVLWAADVGQGASFWSIFDILNALQGVVIFSIFVLQQPVRSLVKSSALFTNCRRKTSGSEVSVVSDRNTILPVGRRDYV